PERPDLDIPPVPPFNMVAVPDERSFTFPEWDVQAPGIDVPELDLSWNFTPEQYVSTLLDGVKSRVETMLQGGTGLPAWAEQALYERADEREQGNELRALQEVDEEFADRGFTEPNGMLHKRVRQVRQNSQNQRNELSRKILTDAIQLEIENI